MSCLFIAYTGILFVICYYTMINYDKSDDTAQVDGWKNIQVIRHFIIPVVFTQPYLDKILLTIKHALSWCDWISAEHLYGKTIILPEEDNVWWEPPQSERCHYFSHPGCHGGRPHFLHSPSRPCPAQGGAWRCKVSWKTKYTPFLMKLGRPRNQMLNFAHSNVSSVTTLGKQYTINNWCQCWKRIPE